MSTVNYKVSNTTIAKLGENAKSDAIIHYGRVSGQPYFQNYRHMGKWGQFRPVARPVESSISWAIQASPALIPICNDYNMSHPEIKTPPEWRGQKNSTNQQTDA